MIRPARALLAALLITSFAHIARAQESSLPALLLEHLDQKVDLKANPELAKELADRGLISRGQASVKVDASFLERVMGNERLREFAAQRYHVGDRVYVQQNGKVTYRAEIAGINDDGTYRVTTWDKLEGIDTPKNGKPVDAITGKVSAKDKKNAPKTRVRVTQPDGTVKEESLLEPWNERANVREITLSHQELDKLNGKVAPSGPYRVNGYLVDPSQDAVLRKAIEKANRKVDQLIKEGKLDLTLPRDPAAAQKKIDEIAKVQRDIIIDIFKTNEMSYTDHGNGGYWDQQYKKMMEDQSFIVKGERLVGAVLKWGVGVCTDQTAALNSIYREIGRRVGFDVRVINGMYTGGYHNFEDIHTIDGRNFINDPSWHSQSDDPWAALENIDFATYDTRPWSNRAFNTFNEAVTDPTNFRSNAARSRDAGDAFLENLLAADAQKRIANGAKPADAVRDAIAARGKLASGDASRLEAAVLARATAPATTSGLLGALAEDRTRIDAKDAR